MSIDKVIAERNHAAAELRDLYNAAGNEPLGAEDKLKEERLSAVIADLGKRTDALALLAESDKRAEEVASSLAAVEAPEAPAEAPKGIFRSLRDMEVREVHLPAPELRDDVNVNITTATDGPELVPTDLANVIHQLMVEESPIMSLANVFTTSGGNTFEMPRITSYSAAALVAEAAAIDNDAPQFDTVSFGAFKYGFQVKVTREAEQDMAFNIGQVVTEQGARALGRGLNAVFVSGPGTTTPSGVDLAATGMTTAAIAAVTVDELIEAQHSIAVPAQRARGTWLFNDSTIEAIRKLKDSNGAYLWQASTQAGQPDVLLGRPVYADPNIAALGTGNDFGVFGDLSGFSIRLAGGVSIDRSEHVGFANDLVHYRFIARADSKLVDTTGIRVLTNA